MEANANKAWDGWRDVWHLMKLALQHQWRCGNFIIQWGWIWWDVLRPMTTSMSLGHCWIQCRGNHKAWGIKIQKCCRINVFFHVLSSAHDVWCAFQTFNSWCWVCISKYISFHMSRPYMFNRHVFWFHMMCFVCMRWVGMSILQCISFGILCCVDFMNGLWFKSAMHLTLTQQGVTLSWWQEFVWGLNVYMILWQSEIQIFSYYIQVCIAYHEDHAEA